jgi:predicted N-formylglutamate amidohydrolase
MSIIDRIFLSCEHAANQVPAAYRQLFAKNPSVLSSPRAFDIGILEVAKRIAGVLRLPLFACFTTRLLIDTNRSLQHPHLFSEFSRNLSFSDKSWLVHNLYHRYRESATQHIGQQIRRNHRILHLSLHSFTPILHGKRRTADIGILYDPKRKSEKSLAVALQGALRNSTGLRIRRNYPYLGHADGFTTALRKAYNARLYLGIEIEINQAMLTGKRSKAVQLAHYLCSSLDRIMT